MKPIKKQVVTDEFMHPVAALIDYQDWQAIERWVDVTQSLIVLDTELTIPKSSMEFRSPESPKISGICGTKHTTQFSRSLALPEAIGDSASSAQSGGRAAIDRCDAELHKENSLEPIAPSHPELEVQGKQHEVRWNGLIWRLKKAE